MKTDDEVLVPSATVPPQNPLAGLPSLPKIHHSYQNCQVSNVPAPNVPCPFPVDSSNVLQLDFARITHAWPVDIALGGGCCPGGMARDANGNTIWDPAVLQKSLNRTEIVEATKLCAKANASITVNFSPWAYYWGGQYGYSVTHSEPVNKSVRDRECPKPWACDPTVQGVDEELELRFFSTQLSNIATWIEQTNSELDAHVRIGGGLN